MCRLRFIWSLHVVLLAGIWSESAAAIDHTFKSGESLATLAETQYGNSAYQLVIIKLNRIKDPAKIADGTVLRLPEFKEMLLAEGFPPKLAPELDEVMKARYGLIRVHEDLSRSLQPGNSTGKVKVPRAVREELTKDATMLDHAANAMARAGKYGDSATRLRQRLIACAVNMKKLASGATDAGLEDHAHLLLAQAFVRGLMMARNEGADQ